MFDMSSPLVIVKGKRNGCPSHCLHVGTVLRTEQIKEIFLRISKIYCHVPFHILKVSVANVSPTPGVRSPPSHYCLMLEIKKFRGFGNICWSCVHIVG
jgi:hypothetical protein